MLPAPVAEPAVQENGEEGGEGKEGKDVDPSSPKKCDIIIISGRREKCEAAKEALQVGGFLSPLVLSGSDGLREGVHCRLYHRIVLVDRNLLRLLTST